MPVLVSQFLAGKAFREGRFLVQSSRTFLLFALVFMQKYLGKEGGHVRNERKGGAQQARRGPGAPAACESKTTLSSVCWRCLQ